MRSWQKGGDDMKSVQKVLFLISNISFGGAQRVTWTLAQWMKKNGVEPVVVAVGYSTNNYTLPEGIKVVQLGQRHSYEVLSTVGKLRRVVRRERPDIVITMGVTTCLFSVPALIGLPVPHIISERNDPRHFLGKTWVKHLSRCFMKKGSGFVFQTREAMDYYPAPIRAKGCVIPNPIMAAKLPLADREHREKTVVTMGRLTAQKNHRLLLNAFAVLATGHPDYRLQIYGFGELRSSMEEQIAAMDLTDKVTLFDACDDVLERIRTAGMFVLSSDFEGMPNALMEAMAMGLPCISTDCPCGGPRYLIRQEENGLLVPVGDVEALAQAMLRLAEDDVLCSAIGEAAAQLREQLSADTVCAQWLAFCEEVVYG